jgi:hypothetical protein
MSKHHGRSSTLAKTVAKSAPKATEPSRERPVEIVGSANGVAHGTGSGVPLEEVIRVRAYQNWERAGRPEGDGASFWFEAESELKSGPAS